VAQVIVDPVELRRFAAALREELSALRERQRSLEAARQGLASVWRDRRYDSFERAYVPAMQALDRFAKAAEAYAHHLGGKAEKAERFLGRR
jgi:uncharacterized protein YukE